MELGNGQVTEKTKVKLRKVFVSSAGKKFIVSVVGFIRLVGQCKRWRQPKDINKGRPNTKT